MKVICVIAIVFVAAWTVIANRDFDRDKSESIWKKYLVDIPTRCPDRDANDTVVHLAHETDCTKFYKCASGIRYLFECPVINNETKEKLHFNKWKQYCDWPEQAGCNNCPGKEEGYPSVKITHETLGCTQYYECSNGQKLLRYCSIGCFSATCQACVRNRTNGNCD